ncbi:MAG: STAS domain-containing protein [Lachnospiraceae bacterium]|nr:STAS domain-containing protein [Lachnospiraceae bacterium]
MDITKEIAEHEMTIRLRGRLETATAPKLEEVVENELDDIMTLTIGMENVEYVSSAGLRILLGAEKKMKAKGGKMVVEHVPDAVMDVFKITGFDKILTLQ